MIYFAVMEKEKIFHGLPTRFVPFGETFVRYGITLRCVSRDVITCPRDACRGCWFAKARKRDGRNVNCADIQCSRWDRMDERNVWFVPVVDE